MVVGSGGGGGGTGGGIVSLMGRISESRRRRFALVTRSESRRCLSSSNFFCKDAFSDLN